MTPSRTIREFEPPVTLAGGPAMRTDNTKKPIYVVHKCWGWCLGSVFRSAPAGRRGLIAHERLDEDRRSLEGQRANRLLVLDRFIAGGTTPGWYSGQDSRTRR